jgi:hypothetical protein
MFYNSQCFTQWVGTRAGTVLLRHGVLRDTTLLLMESSRRFGDEAVEKCVYEVRRCDQVSGGRDWRLNCLF